MAYLIFRHKMDQLTVGWMNRNAIRFVDDVCWVFNNTMEHENAIAIPIGDDVIKALQDHIRGSIDEHLNEIEGMIRDRPRGSRVIHIRNRLNLCIEASTNLEQIAYAKDMLSLMGAGDPGEKTTIDVPKYRSLGIDQEATRNYILKLAKKDTIH
jgi:hypothetical protein